MDLNSYQYDDGSFIQAFDDGSVLIGDSNGNVEGIPAGAEINVPVSTTVNIQSVQGNVSNDHRVRIKVPPEYLTYTTGGFGNALQAVGGILFPYTPQINYDVRADYSSVNPTHSNYTQYFYQRSAVGTITISGRFTVQNDGDAVNYISTIYLLKSLMKMPFGSRSNGGDAMAGSPPPVCRLYGYGSYIFENVPVALTNYRVDLPENVDYYTMNKGSTDSRHGRNTVPILSTIAVTCIPVYSRAEMQKFSVKSYLNDRQFIKGGYL